MKIHLVFSSSRTRARGGKFDLTMLEKHNHRDQRMMEHLCNACEIGDTIVNCGTTKFERTAYAPRSEWAKYDISRKRSRQKMLKELQNETKRVHRNEIMCVHYIHAQSKGAEDDAELKAKSNRTKAYGLQSMPRVPQGWHFLKIQLSPRHRCRSR